MGLGILYLRGEEPEDVEWGWSSLRRRGWFPLMPGGARRGDYTSDFCGNVLAFRERCDIFFFYRSI